MLNKRLQKYILVLILLLFPLNVYGEEKAATYCISQINAPQKPPEHLAMNFSLETATDRAGWTWVNRQWDGDAWVSSRLTNPDKSKTIQMPELYYCNRRGCEVAAPMFSEATGIAFISGEEKSLLGLLSSPKAYAVYGEKVISLPASEVKATNFRGDVIIHGLAALNGPSNEFLLFDGEKIINTPVKEIQPRKDGLSSWMISNDLNTKRAFLHSNGFRDTPMFLYEILKGAELKKIDLDKNINGWPVLLSLPNDTQQWIIVRDGIFAEIDNKFQRIAYPPPSTHIKGPADVGLIDNGRIYFELERQNKNKQYLVLSKYSSDCGLRLSLDNDTLISLTE